MDWRVAAFPLLVVMLAPATAAQTQQDMYSFDIQAEDTTAVLDVNEAARIPITFRDLSHDSTQGVAGATPVPNVGVSQHQVTFTYTPLDEDVRGWSVLTPMAVYSRGGESFELEVIVSASQLATNPYFPFTLTAKIQATGGPYFASINLTALTLGLASFNAQAGDVGGELRPGQIVDIPIRITNGALFPRGFDIKVTENTCGLRALTSTNNLVPGKTTKIYTVSTRAPTDKLWFFSEICLLGIEVSPNDSRLATRSVQAPLIINGGYMNPLWVIRTVELGILLLVIFWIIARRKARVEEEILGKPQKPWTIPVEVLYLKALKEKDERAWYVVRHHLMEEEYRSALLWYHSYKAATKGSRKKESTVLRQEKVYKRWRKQWKRVIAKPIKEADRFEAKLQRKLDRQARADYRKQTGKYDAVRAKMEKSYAGQVERALAAWEKDVRKAQKKGQPLPQRPTVPEPDYPAEPDEQGIALADHKWAAKAERFRAKMVRKQGDLEVKFEKADQRYLRKLRRKIGRLARKLDDPTFIDEHPLLKPTES